MRIENWEIGQISAMSRIICTAVEVEDISGADECPGSGYKDSADSVMTPWGVEDICSVLAGVVEALVYDFVEFLGSPIERP